MTTNFFKQLYTKAEGLDSKVIVDCMTERVTREMNEALTKDFTEKEVGDALFQIGPLKAPGLDGFPARFFQRNWSTVGQDVVNAVLNFFMEGGMPGYKQYCNCAYPKEHQTRIPKGFLPN